MDSSYLHFYYLRVFYLLACKQSSGFGRFKAFFVIDLSWLSNQESQRCCLFEQVFRAVVSRFEIRTVFEVIDSKM